MNAEPEQYSNYKILPDEKIIVEYYYGEVTENVIIDMKKLIASDSEYNNSYSSILDFRDSVFDISSSGMKTLVAFIRDNLVHDDNRKIGLLTHTPKHVVVTTLFTNHDDDYQCNIRYSVH